MLASHMDVMALDLTGSDGDGVDLERLGAENVKRIVRGKADGQSPYDIAAFLELKTVWHPIDVIRAASLRISGRTRNPGQRLAKKQPTTFGIVVR